MDVMGNLIFDNKQVNSKLPPADIVDINTIMVYSQQLVAIPIKIR